MYRRISLFAFLLLSACSHSENTGHAYFGQMENIRESGTVVSIKQGGTIAVTGLHGAIVGTSAAAAGNTAATAVSSTALSPLSGAFGSFGNLFGGGSKKIDASLSDEFEYVIRKTDGTLVTIDQIPSENEPVLYPGQSAVIQTNGDYIRVYPADVEFRH